MTPTTRAEAAGRGPCTPSASVCVCVGAVAVFIVGVIVFIADGGVIVGDIFIAKVIVKVGVGAIVVLTVSCGTWVNISPAIIQGMEPGPRAKNTTNTRVAPTTRPPDQEEDWRRGSASAAATSTPALLAAPVPSI